MRFVFACLAVVAVYLTGVFVVAEWDPSKWDALGRFVTAMFAWGVFIGVLVLP